MAAARPLPAADPVAEARSEYQEALAGMLAAHVALAQCPAAIPDDAVSVMAYDDLVRACQDAERRYRAALREVRRLHEAPAPRPMEAAAEEDDGGLGLARGVVASVAVAAVACAFPVAVFGWPWHSLTVRIVAGAIVAAGVAWAVVVGRMWEVGGR